MSVALLAEGVDRNSLIFLISAYGKPVALLAEGVDRNKGCADNSSDSKVALLAEGVDRNWGGADYGY